ncbi:MAG TPA: hypothetical protein VMU57_17955 [Edaphobacter sp.]|uniref:hypothetical protein n=1 Tax=Edaphobacter sp. TaxID=1934404 RepID=UPI002C96D90E|nr:hypothetical protein [Edaphobacter sp.]HUZ96792.1 hypothetical protein [Edaphobacter sp.]
MQRLMSGLKMAATWKNGTRTASGMLLGAMLVAGTAAMAQATGKLAAAPPVSYANRYEIYGGLNFMNFQAGQNLPTRMNFGGGEILGTYWLTKRVGLAADYRGEAGTTPVFPSAPIPPNLSTIDRPLVYMNMGMLGAQLRGPKNQFAAINLHGYFGVAHGVFDGGTGGVPPEDVGLYTNRTKPIAAVGGSLDINRSKNFAVRLSPDMIFEHFGTETREFFAISAGVVYRFGKN